jgi:glutaredoxin
MSGKITVFSRDNCAFCERAKVLLEERSLEYDVVSLEKDFRGDKEAFKKAIADKMPPKIEFSTVPQIFIGEVYVGGYRELKVAIGS